MLPNSSSALDVKSHLHSQTNPRVHESVGPLILSRGRGARVIDADGREYIEGMAGLWNASLGFADERLAKAAYRQMTILGTYHTFNHRANNPSIELVSEISKLSPIKDPKVFLASSGSEANETMIKLVWYYNIARGLPNKRRIISRQGAFHGSSIFASALCGLPHMHNGFGLPGTDILYTRKPHYYHEARSGESEDEFVERLLIELEEMIIENNPDSIAAMIVEPVMGAGGVVVPPEGYFRKLSELLARYDILLLSDEVVCGFGRTGNWFGCQTFGFKPAMISVAKGLSAGHLPLSAVILDSGIYEIIADQADRLGVLAHGFTYSGHPVAAAVGVEALRIYQEMDMPEISRKLGGRLFSRLRTELSELELVGEIRGVGFLAGIELVANRETHEPFPNMLRVGAEVEKRSRDSGLIIRNMGDVIALCPPYVIDIEEIDELVSRLHRAIDDTASYLRTMR